MMRVQDIAHRLRVLLKQSKEVGPTTTITFLGIELHSVAMAARLPPEKLQKLMAEMLLWVSRKESTKRELQSKIGKLSFVCKVVFADRIFLWLIDVITSVSLGHHHLSITSEASKDFRWWYEFLTSWNSVAMMLNPHISTDMELYTDTSGAHGFGAYYQGEWFRGNWQEHQTLESRKSIAWQELVVVVLACLT